MPSANLFQGREDMANDDFMKKLAESFLTGNNTDIVDAITFIEAPWGLSIKLFPTQRFILKCYYGMKLDDTEETIEVPDLVNDKILYRFTEKAFLKWLYHEKRCNTDTTEGMQFRELVLVLGRRSGKCRYINDLIPTTVGSITFGELLKRKNNKEKVGITTYNPDNLVKSITYDFKIWDNGIKPCYKLKTRTGVEEISSDNHPYLIWRDDWEQPKFIDLSELKIGDRIAIAKSSPMFGQKTIGINRAKLLGYLLGDGGITCDVSFTTKDIKKVEEIQSILDVEFPGYLIKKKGKKKYGYNITHKDGKKKRHINQIKLWLQEIGVFGYKSKHKFVPQCILQASKEEVGAFISRIYSCDGWATGNTIGYCSASDSLVQGLKHLLLKFGILTSLTEKMALCDGKRFHANTLSIYEMSSLRRFQTEINIFLKEDKVKQVVNLRSNAKNTTNLCYTLPKGVVNRIERLRDKASLSHRDIIGPEDKCRIRPQYAPTRYKTIVYGEKLNDKFIIDMCHSDVLWDAVKSIEQVGEVQTIDLCVNDTHIIGGDIISHNSTMSSCISAYELYKLIKRGDPSTYYNFPPQQSIVIMNVAPTDEQAGVVFDQTMKLSMNCPYLRDRTVNRTQSYFNLQTDADMKIIGRKMASLTCLAGGCSSNSLRGRNALTVIMDEMAFFIDNGGRFSGDEVYKALTPSTTTFRGEGKVICISSPYAKYGKFYDRYLESFDEKETTLMFKMYSAMVNPQVDPIVLKTERRRNRVGFMCEYGGEFSDSITAWIEDENEFKKCINVNRQMSGRGQVGTTYFMGVDLGIKNDGAAIGIVHKDDTTNKIVLDYADVFYSGSSDVWEREQSIYSGCNKFAKQELIQVSDVAKEIQELVKWFPIKSGWFDQFNGYSLMEKLYEMNLKQFHMENVTEILNSEIYMVFKDLYAAGMVELIDHPIAIPELLSLEAERKAKNRIIVRAPNKAGSHDDISDAIARAIWECYANYKQRPANITSLMGKNGTVIVSGQQQAVGASTLNSYAANKILKHGINPQRPLVAGKNYGGRNPSFNGRMF